MDGEERDVRIVRLENVIPNKIARPAMLTRLTLKVTNLK